MLERQTLALHGRTVVDAQKIFTVLVTLSKHFRLWTRYFSRCRQSVDPLIFHKDTLVCLEQVLPFQIFAISASKDLDVFSCSEVHIFVKQLHDMISIKSNELV